MFYSQFILAKKGPLGTIWIAAHLERKLRKNQVADTDIGVSVDSILSPDVPIALRLSSHLLLGVVRIYSKKVNYLFDDCSDALLKVKQAFCSTAVDLPPEQSKAPYHSITLPETFDLDDFEIPDDEILQGNFVDHHVSARENITLQDTLDGVAFSTSQFGPDERFGDGDASQIGLDLDEDMFLDKNEAAAGTSRVPMDMDVDPPAPVKASSPVKDGDHDESGFNPSPAASAINFSIQAPSTPGLVEEPNLPTAQALLSDDHIDEDHNPSELAVKEVSRPLNRQDLPHFGNPEFHANGSCDQQDEQDDEKVGLLGVEYSAETMEALATSKTQPPVSGDYVEATNGPDSVGNVVGCDPAENESNMATEIPFEWHSNKIFTPMPDIASAMEVHSENSVKNGVHSLMLEAKSENMQLFGSEVPNLGKTDSNIVNRVSEPQNEGELHPNIGISDTKSELIPQVGSEVPNLGDTDPNIINSSSECQNKGELYSNMEISETFGSDVHGKLSAPTLPVLQNCNSRDQNASTEVDSLVNTSNFPVEDDRLCLVGMPGKDDLTNVSSLSTDVQDSMRTNLGTDQPTDQVTDAGSNYVDGNLYDKVSMENNLEKENDCKTSDLPAVEKLVSMPNLAAGQLDDFFVESTPIQENTDADNVVSGRKRSYNESTLTVQSLNSVESFGAAQSKQSAECIPEDDDLLSSILVGRRSTTLKMKPTPPVADTVSTKRQRVAMRTTAHKRKVLVDHATVLHGDMIRQQLTSTEDIRRVRKKAPGTRLEIWMLQKQFLEDKIFTEPVFAGMSASLLSLHYETFNLGSIKIFEGVKGIDNVDISSKGTLGQEAEYVSTVLSTVNDDGAQNQEGIFEAPIMLDIDSSSPHKVIRTVDGEIGNGSECMDVSLKAALGPEGTIVHSTTNNDGGQHHGESLELPSDEISISGLDGSSLHKEIKTLDNEVPKDGLQYHASDTKVETGTENDRVLLGTEAMGAGLASAVGPVSEAYSSHLNGIGVDSAHVDTSSQFEDERCEMNSTKEGACTREDAYGASNRYQEGGFTAKGLDLDKKSDADCLFEEPGGVDKVVTSADIQDHSSRFHDVNVSVPFKHEAHLTSDEVMEVNQLGDFALTDDCSLSVHDDLHASDQRDNGSAQTPWNLVDGLKFDSLYSIEADLSSLNTISTEKENPECRDTDPKKAIDPTTVHMDHIYSGEHADYETDVVEHDTDFLNVDDDVAEDYESDTPNADEKRILDNTGWSSRTRAVANYLQVLFEKEAQHGKKNVFVDSLLGGKSRKEAARMFFETLVLKTKDYIEVEQESPFGDIRINPRGKLLKSEF